MTKQQRKELRSLADLIQTNAGLALTIAWEAAKGKTEAEALEQIDELMRYTQANIQDIRHLVDEIRSVSS